MELIDGCLFEEYFNQWVQVKDNTFAYMGQVTKVRLSCYLVLLSNDSKTS